MIIKYIASSLCAVKFKSPFLFLVVRLQVSSHTYRCTFPILLVLACIFLLMNAGAPLTPESYGSVYMTSNLVSDIGALTVRQYHRDAL